MIISDYLNTPDKVVNLESIISYAKQSNIHNPAVLYRDDDYVAKHRDSQLAKKFQATPILIKDNILLEGTLNSFGSKMGDQYIAPYSATVVRKLEAAGFLICGKTTMDEFAMGSTGENSPFPLPHNVIDPHRVAGGSSSGSAVAVASGQVALALGTDTGGSVRTPAAYNGIVGLKPSYGAVSRYGVQAMASSFDQVGVLATTVDDARTVFRIIRGQDDHDTTTRAFNRNHKIKSLAGLRIGIPQQFFADGLNPKLGQVIQEALHRYESQGAILIDLDIPLIDAGIAVYYTLVNAEVSSNLARFDGLKYGQQGDTHHYTSHHEYIAAMRDQGFGLEVKRRILAGAHVLSASEYEGLYLKAMAIRTNITAQCMNYLDEQVDVIMGPTTPDVAPIGGEDIDDPVKTYLADAYTVIANITGLPALSIPAGFISLGNTKLPVGLQLIGAYGGEEDLFTLAEWFENRQ